MSLLAAVIIITTTAAHTQSQIRVFEGTSLGGRFGHAAASAGDVNADGFDDVIVGAPYDEIAAGRAWVYSGTDGAEVLALVSPTDGAGRFGTSVAGIGDIDADGFGDIVVGAPSSEADGADRAGSAWVFSGRTGEPLLALHGTEPRERFGWVVAAAGDVDADGTPDVLVGSPAGNCARVFSGHDGALIHRYDGRKAGDRLGVAVASAGDIDADGHVDILIGADQALGDGPGYAAVYSGRTHAPLFVIEGQEAGGGFGGSVSGAGDVDGDGHLDFIIGSGTHDDHRALRPAGLTRVFSGRDGSVIHELPWRGAFVAAAGDVDEDGHADLLIGTPSDHETGSLHVVSGLRGDELMTVEGDDVGDRFGVSVAGVGDMDGDGHPDIIVGADEFLSNAPPRGSVKVISVHGPTGGTAGTPATDAQS
jgi:hypothetical protein